MDIIRSLINRINLDNVMLMLIAITFIGCFIFRVDYFNFKNVFKGYIDAFRDAYDNLNVVGLMVTILLPLWIAIYVVHAFRDYQTDYQTELLVVTILSALFFSIFGLAFELKKKIYDKKEDISASDKIRLIKIADSLININMFEIVISVAILILSFAAKIVEKYEIYMRYLIYYLLFLLLFNIFIIFKRMQVLFDKIKKENK